MSLKSMSVAYSPSSVISVAKKIRILARCQAARQLRRRLCSSAEPIQLELGSGNKSGINGWTTLDVAPGCDMYCDLAEGIPFPNQSVAAIYSSHFFEHLTYKEAQILLDECLRVLIPDGKFLICVPDASLYLRAYVTNDAMDEARFLAHRPAYNSTTKLDYVNYIAYMNGQHKYMFDEENLLHILRQKGFRKVRIREFDGSIDMLARRHESIHAEGYK